MMTMLLKYFGQVLCEAVAVPQADKVEWKFKVELSDLSVGHGIFWECFGMKKMTKKKPQK